MFFIRLPQLAVLAKILCLLMVVMCGAVPAMVRSVSLYSTCSSGNVTVFGRTVKATSRNDHNAPYQKLSTQSEDFSRKLYIYAEESKRYICFSKRWKVVSLPKKKRDEYCQFYEIYNGRYLMYKSAVDPNRLLGFNKRGKPMTSPRGRQECYNFIKLNPNANVDQHNDIISSSRGGMKRRPDHHHHHHHQQHHHHSNNHNNNKNSNNNNNNINSSSPRKSLLLDTIKSNSNSNHNNNNSNNSNKSNSNTQQQQQQQQHRHHQRSHKNSPKNSLQTQSKSRLISSGTTSHHRHRHANSWKKMRQIDLSTSSTSPASARRRHHTLRYEDNY